MSATQTPEPVPSATARAMGVLAYLRSVIQSGESIDDAEYAVVDEVIAALKQAEQEQAELLEAVEDLIDIADRVRLDLDYEEKQQRIARARAAIAKARGTS